MILVVVYGHADLALTLRFNDPPRILRGWLRDFFWRWHDEGGAWGAAGAGVLELGGNNEINIEQQQQFTATQYLVEATATTTIGREKPSQHSSRGGGRGYSGCKSQSPHRRRRYVWGPRYKLIGLVVSAPGDFTATRSGECPANMFPSFLKLANSNRAGGAA